MFSHSFTLLQNRTNTIVTKKDSHKKDETIFKSSKKNPCHYELFKLYVCVRDRNIEPLSLKVQVWKKMLSLLKECE